MTSAKKDVCSIWTGNPLSKNEDEFEKFINEQYDSKGDAATSEFLRGFNVDYFDQDFIESVYKDDLFSFENEVGNFSFADSFKEAAINEASLQKIQQVHSIIVLYGFTYNGKISDSNGIKFLGTFPFTRS